MVEDSDAVIKIYLIKNVTFLPSSLCYFLWWNKLLFYFIFV